MDNLRARLEVLEYVAFGRDWTLRNHPALHKPVSSDTAACTYRLFIVAVEQGVVACGPECGTR